MASTSSDAVRDLRPADLEAAAVLSSVAGWNQVAADWRLFIELGHPVVIDDADGQLAATAATLSLGPEVAWISMVIVRPDQRRQGMATRLLERCAREIEAGGRTPGLDATPAGREVYRRMGFRDGPTLARWRRTEAARLAPSAPPADLKIRPFTPSDLGAIALLDRGAFGFEREPLLSRLGERSSGFAAVAWEGGRPSGFLLGRDGRTASHLGPVVADDADVACSLLRHALERIEGGVTIDVLDAFIDVTDWLAASGFERERPFTRMHRGSYAPRGASTAVAIAGPELG